MVLNIPETLIKSLSWTHKYNTISEYNIYSWNVLTNIMLFFSQEGEVREVTIDVVNDGYSNLGRRATLIEKLLGVSSTVFEDGLRIMVASIIPNTPVDNQRSIKIGDYLI